MVNFLVSIVEQHNLSQKLSMFICLFLMYLICQSCPTTNHLFHQIGSLIYSCKLNQLGFGHNILFYATCNWTQITIFKLDKSNLETLNWLTGFSSALFKIGKRKSPIINFIRRYFQVIKRFFYDAVSFILIFFSKWFPFWNKSIII